MVRQVQVNPLMQDGYMQTAPIRGTFIALNCSAIAENLIESEMFGHEKERSPMPRMAVSVYLKQPMAHPFLDEVTSLSLSAQAKLLLAIESRKSDGLEETKTSLLMPVSLQRPIVI